MRGGRPAHHQPARRGHRAGERRGHRAARRGGRGEPAVLGGHRHLGARRAEGLRLAAGPGRDGDGAAHAGAVLEHARGHLHTGRSAHRERRQNGGGVDPMTDERIVAVTMPKWGLSMQAGKITVWIAGEGDEVSAGDDLADIETEKIAGTLDAAAEPAVEAAEVGGRKISYVGTGQDGDVVLLVHGYGGDRNSWLFLQEPMAARYRVYALDLPGHGTSVKDVGDGSVGTLADAVLGVLDAIGAEHAHLVGHSLGGAAVLTAAARDPRRI